MKSIRLQGTHDKHYRGHARYVVALDHAAGRRDRYFVWLVTSKDPVTIGRELDLATVRQVISRFETHFSSHPFFGDRRSAILATTLVFKKENQA